MASIRSALNPRSKSQVSSNLHIYARDRNHHDTNFVNLEVGVKPRARFHDTDFRQFGSGSETPRAIPTTNCQKGDPVGFDKNEALTDHKMSHGVNDSAFPSFTNKGMLMLPPTFGI